MKKLKRKFTLRTAVLTAATIALLVSATVFMAVGAEGEVTPSDVSPTAPPSVHDGGGKTVSCSVSPTEMLEPAQNLGEPVITMTTDLSIGESIHLGITGTGIFVSLGDEETIELGTVTNTYYGFGEPVWNFSKEISSSEFKTIKLYGNITELNCLGNQLTSLNVSNAPSLEVLVCDSNYGISNLDVSNNTALTCLNCRFTNLSNLDLSNNANLTTLECDGNQLKTLSLSNNKALTSLSCSGNQLSTLDISHNTALETLSCTGNHLLSLNVSNNSALEVLFCESNNLTAIDVSHNNTLCVLSCRDNNMPLSAVASVDINALMSHAKSKYGDNYNYGHFGYQYAPQTIIIPSSIEKGESIDLSAQSSVNDTATVFTWYDSDGNIVTPASSTGGVFTFGDDATGKTLVCKMTNAALPDFKDGVPLYDEEHLFDNRMTTTEVKINEPLDEPAITMSADKAIGEGITLGIYGTGIWIDSGEGSAVEYGDLSYYDYNDRAISIPLKSKTIKIYGNISHLACSGNNLTALDVSGCSELVELDCSNNQLPTIDLSKNTELMYLYCDSNNLTSLDFSECNNLRVIECCYNQLTTLNVSYLLHLLGLRCDNNKLTTISLPRFIWYLYCNNNQLTTLNLSEICIFELYCTNNNITSLNLSRGDIKMLFCNHNQLSELNLSNCIGLGTLNCSYNLLTDLNVSDCSNLHYLDSSYNRLSLNTLYNIDRDTMHDDPQNEGLEAGFWYAPQTHIIPDSVNVGEEIDLSSEYIVDGAITEFNWYDSQGNTIDPATANAGKFSFGANTVGKTLICKMTNSMLPRFKKDGITKIGDWNSNHDHYDVTQNITDTRLTTTEISIKAAESSPAQLDDQEDNSIPVNDNSFVSEAEHSDDAVIEANGSEIPFDGVHLVVGNIEKNKKKTVLDAIAHFAQTFNVTEDNTALYDISLRDSHNVKVTVKNGKIKICLKYPDNLGRQSEKYTFRLFHQKDDGTIEEIPITLQPNGICFEIDNFSPFALVWNAKSGGGTENSPGTGESIMAINMMAILFFLSALGINIVLYRRRKTHNV